MSSIDKISTSTYIFWNSKSRASESKSFSKKADSLEISNTARVYDKIDKFMNLGERDRLDISDLNDEEKKEFLKILSALIKRGVVGYEVLEVNGKPEKQFVENQIGSDRLKGAKLYSRKDLYRLKGI
ncbi:MAG: hypothetical protein FD143_1571 [Ignavibacteria bacterium]|nr:MAG: hypothetical protein FD143_1571 [Ignavibacteria bacterium]KAF0160460.1 MAG: hypothetical protein FD188_1732 [Ignavibacteria bacterium]